jgi:hypothetical protein
VSGVRWAWLSWLADMSQREGPGLSHRQDESSEPLARALSPSIFDEITREKFVSAEGCI